MRDLQQILERIAELESAGSPCVLATVVEAQGSVYRGAGTRMLIESLEKSTGVINGGCLEGDVREQAVGVLEDGQPRIVCYDAHTEDDVVFGTGLGCSGLVRVFFQRLSAADPSLPLEYLRASALGTSNAALATVFACDGIAGVQPGQCVAVADDLPVRNDIAHGDLSEWVRAELDHQRDMGGRRAVTRHAEIGRGRASVLVETLRPPLELVVCGAGCDAQPVVHFARQLGWRVSVVDHRPSYARPERFPGAQRVALAVPGQWPDEVEVSAGMAAVVMTHNYLQDGAMLRYLLPRELMYLGLLGPHQRTQRLLEELACEGIVADAGSVLFSPVGLDIGAETPEEIALAMVSEIQAALLGRSGGSLRLRSGSIHDRSE